MDFSTQSHTSFIPKAPLAETTPSSYKKRRMSLFTLLALVIFIVSIFLSGGVFIYKIYLERSLEDKKVSLERARAAFEPSLIEELKRLNKRIEHSKSLLGRHNAFSSLFDTLEESTLQNVQFKSFNLTSAPDGKSEVTLTGLGRNYTSVALQSDVFSKTKGIKEPLFSQLNLDASGGVAFTVSATLDPDAFRYSNLFEIIDEGGTLNTRQLEEGIVEEDLEDINLDDLDSLDEELESL